MMELTVYLAKKILHVIPANLCFVSAFENQRTGHLGSEQEETDTKMLLHALDATNSWGNKHSYVLSKCWCVRACTEALS